MLNKQIPTHITMYALSWLSAALLIAITIRFLVFAAESQNKAIVTVFYVTMSVILTVLIIAFVMFGLKSKSKE